MAKRRESVGSRTIAGDAMRRMKSGKAANGMGGAMRVVAVVVAMLDVVVGRERERAGEPARGDGRVRG